MKLQTIFEHYSIHDLRPEHDIYYHGTSTAVGVRDKLLPPDMTDVISERGRKRNLDKVFFTRDYRSAEIYAGRTARELGGSPVVFRVHPVGEVEVLNQQQGTTVFMAPWAYVEPV